MPLPEYKILSKSPNQFKSSLNLRSLNVRHFETVKAMVLNSMESRSSSTSSSSYKISSKSKNRLKVAAPQKFKRPQIWSDRRHLQCHHLHTKFHPNPPVISNVIRRYFSPTSYVYKRSPFWNEATVLSSME
jgi:hypothetical protein